MKQAVDKYKKSDVKKRRIKAKENVHELQGLNTLDTFLSKTVPEDLEMEDCSELDLSSIINTIVSRPISNPALEHYHKMKL